jgi:hypothetical protein
MFFAQVFRAEETDYVAHVSVVDSVKDSLVFAALLYESGQSQDCELLRDVRELAFVYDVHDVVHAELALREHADDSEARLVRDELEQGDDAIAERVVFSELTLDAKACWVHRFISY